MDARRKYEELVDGLSPETQELCAAAFNLGLKVGVRAALKSISRLRPSIERNVLRDPRPAGRHDLRPGHAPDRTLEGIPENHEMPFNAWIEDLQLTIRPYNILKREGISTIDKLLLVPLEELRTMRNFGPKVEEEIRSKLAAFGYRLNGDDPNRKPVPLKRRQYLDGLTQNPEMPFDAPIESLGLKPQARRILKREGINTIEQLLTLPRWRMDRFIGFGDVSRHSVNNRLAAFGYSVYDGVLLL